jgi:hypothetical protein
MPKEKPVPQWVRLKRRHDPQWALEEQLLRKYRLVGGIMPREALERDPAWRMEADRFNFLDAMCRYRRRDEERIAYDGERFAQQMCAISRSTPEMKQAQGSGVTATASTQSSTEARPTIMSAEHQVELNAPQAIANSMPASARWTYACAVDRPQRDDVIHGLYCFAGESD